MLKNKSNLNLNVNNYYSNYINNPATSRNNVNACDKYSINSSNKIFEYYKNLNKNINNNNSQINHSYKFPINSPVDKNSKINCVSTNSNKIEKIIKENIIPLNNSNNLNNNSNKNKNNPIKEPPISKFINEFNLNSQKSSKKTDKDEKQTNVNNTKSNEDNNIENFLKIQVNSINNENYYNNLNHNSITSPNENKSNNNFTPSLKKETSFNLKNFREKIKEKIGVLDNLTSSNFLNNLNPNINHSNNQDDYDSNYKSYDFLKIKKNCENFDDLLINMDNHNSTHNQSESVQNIKSPKRNEKSPENLKNNLNYYENKKKNFQTKIEKKSERKKKHKSNSLIFPENSNNFINNNFTPQNINNFSNDLEHSFSNIFSLSLEKDKRFSSNINNKQNLSNIVYDKNIFNLIDAPTTFINPINKENLNSKKIKPFKKNTVNNLNKKLFKIIPESLKSNKNIIIINPENFHINTKQKHKYNKSHINNDFLNLAKSTNDLNIANNSENKKLNNNKLSISIPKIINHKTNAVIVKRKANKSLEIITNFTAEEADNQKIKTMKNYKTKSRNKKINTEQYSCTISTDNLNKKNIIKKNIKNIKGNNLFLIKFKFSRKLNYFK